MLKHNKEAVIIILGDINRLTKYAEISLNVQKMISRFQHINFQVYEFSAYKTQTATLPYICVVYQILGDKTVLKITIPNKLSSLISAPAP